MNASLFLKVSKEDFDAKVKDIYIRAIRDTFGDVPYGATTAMCPLAGAMNLAKTAFSALPWAPVKRLAMWIRTAVSPVGSTSWPSPRWTCPQRHGGRVVRRHRLRRQVFSQDSVIKLAPPTGISLSADLSRAEKLKEVQKLMDQGGFPAEAIYRSIGVYLGHSLALYHHFYGFKHVLLLGRVMSGRGGDIILTPVRRCWPTSTRRWPAS